MTGQDARWYLDERGRFVVENYSRAEPFSSFFPGIAGRWGIPLWVYFVNRAQCISSLGLRDKDNAIMEFFPFNKACQLAGTQGFRTFLKAGGDVFEPFKAGNAAGVSQRLVISAGELELCEADRERGVETSVAYFPLVNMPVAGLVRRVVVMNRNAEPLALELLD
ncbi:MAG: hypothetical protein JW699_05965, partial [Chitinispirillaceae bacterium]|nr:hypothetical protein [Chitinispirillaceae bacterium]